MHKKSGFTLAEVLITMAIIGVVAALTSPALVGSFQKSKVGPSLRRFVTNLENANEHIMADTDAIRLSDVATSNQEYLEALSKYLNGATQKKNDSNEIMKLSDLTLSAKNYSGKADGAPIGDALIYTFNGDDAFAVNFYEADIRTTNRAKANNRGAYKGDIGTVYYDLNGFNTKPNRLGKDIFVFHLDDTGMLIPEGGKLQWNAYTQTANEQTWKSDENNLCGKKGVTTGASCAGSVADNNWKVIYKY